MCKILDDCKARIILTHTARKATWEQMLPNRQNPVECLAIDEIPEQIDTCWQPPEISPDTLTHLQYTSGTTGQPKGVMVSHSNLFHNLAMISDQLNHNTETVLVSWLPHFHDMGLVGKILQAPFLGGHLIFMEPISFLAKPIRWLKALSRFQGHTSAAPNFAYQYCIERIEDKDLESIDLSNWRNACNGSEVVRIETLEQFHQKFAQCGFQKRAFMPCYGIAEATLWVCSLGQDEEPWASVIDQRSLEQNQVIYGPCGEERPVRAVVSHGRQTLQDIFIVNPDTLLAYESLSVGEIWVKGPSICKGYWKKPKATREQFHANLATGAGPFLRTGDLGFMNEHGELFITGRFKDMIIIRGHNYYPQDIEATLQSIDRSLRFGYSAAFSIDFDNREKIVVLQEVDKRHIPRVDMTDLLSRAKKALTSELAVDIDTIGLLRQGALPVTTSGKVQRHRCREKFLKGDFTFLGCLE